MKSQDYRAAARTVDYPAGLFEDCDDMIALYRL